MLESVIVVQSPVKKTFTRQDINPNGNNILSEEDCQNIGSTMVDVATGQGIDEQAVADSIHSIVSNRLRMVKDSHNDWNDFINQVNYPCPVRVQNNHFPRRGHRKIAKGTRNP